MVDNFVDKHSAKLKTRLGLKDTFEVKNQEKPRDVY